MDVTKPITNLDFSSYLAKVSRNVITKEKKNIKIIKLGVWKKNINVFYIF